MRPSLRTALPLALLLVLPCRGSETVHLVSGFQLTAKSHTLEGDRLTLVTATGTIQLASSQVESIESVLDPTPAAVLAPPLIIKATPESPLQRLSRAALLQGNAPEFNRLVRSVAMVESGLNPQAISPKGALGWMQLMPSTAKELGVEASDPDQNAQGGAKLLAELLERYHYDSARALAAYNAGIGAVKRYGGIPPFTETQAYVRRVLKIYAQLTAAETISLPKRPNP